MIGLFLLYFIGKTFYNLAHEYDKQRWLYAILGVISYYAGTYIGGILLVIILEFAAPGFVDSTDDIVLGLIIMPFGLLACWGLHTILKKKWSQQEIFTEDMIDEIGRESEF
jgi:hypothetical protein